LNKITEISQIKDLLKIAVKLRGEKNFLDSLDTLNRIDSSILQGELKDDYAITKASLYFNLNLLDMAIDTLAQTYADGKASKVVYLTLSFIYLYCNNFSITHHYWEFGVECGYFRNIDELIGLINEIASRFSLDVLIKAENNLFADDFDEDYDDFDDIDDFAYYDKEIELLDKKRDKEIERILKKVEKLIHYNDIEKAKMLLYQIPEDSVHFTKACYLLYLCSCKEGRFWDARAYLYEKNIDPNNVLILVERIKLEFTHGYGRMSLNIIKRNLERFEKLQNLDISAYKSILDSLKYSKFHDVVYKYCQIVLKQEPYDIETLIMASISASNLGYKQQAREYMITVLNLDSDNFVAKLFCRVYIKKSKNIEYMLGDNNLEFVRFLKQLDDFCRSDYYPLDSYIVDGIKWYILNHNTKLQKCLLDKVATMPEFSLFLRQALLKKDVDRFIKKQILFRVLKNIIPTKNDKKSKEEFLSHQIYMAIDDLLLHVPIVLPKHWIDSNIAVKIGFMNAYAATALAKLDYCFNFVKKYEDISCELYIRKNIFNDPNTVAAILMYFCSGLAEFRRQRICIDFFGANKNKFKEYKTILDNSVKRNKQFLAQWRYERRQGYSTKTKTNKVDVN